MLSPENLCSLAHPLAATNHRRVDACERVDAVSQTPLGLPTTEAAECQLAVGLALLQYTAHDVRLVALADWGPCADANLAHHHRWPYASMFTVFMIQNFSSFSPHFTIFFKSYFFQLLHPNTAFSFLCFTHFFLLMLDWGIRNTRLYAIFSIRP